MNQYTLLLDLGIIFLAAMAGGLLARWLKQPVLLGYLAAGLVIGPNTPGFTGNVQAVKVIANWGVTLLMFSVGVHFNLRTLWPMRRVAVGGGLLQMAATGLLGYGTGRLLGFGAFESAYLGCALSISSTLVAMKTMEERGETSSVQSRTMLGILIVQDIATVLMVGLLPVVGGAAKTGAVGVLPDIGRNTALLFAVVGTLFLVYPRLLQLAVRAGTHEVFILTVVSTCFVAAFAVEDLGFSIELGAFIAGLIVSESDLAHQVLAEVVPLRDLFGSVFFVSIGMMMQPAFAVEHWPMLAAVCLVVLAGKAAIAAGAVRASGMHPRIAVISGMGLAQIGEFSFVLAGVGLDAKVISRSLYDLILCTAVVTIALTPLWVSLGPRAYRALTGRAGQASDTDAETPEGATGGHVIIAGCSRMGGRISDLLQEAGIPQVVVDYDYGVVERVRARGIRAVYGDAARPQVLEQTYPETARVAVVTLPDPNAAAEVVGILKRRNPALECIVRARTRQAARICLRQADHVVHPELVAGQAAANMVMDIYGRPEVPLVENTEKIVGET